MSSEEDERGRDLKISVKTEQGVQRTGALPEQRAGSREGSQGRLK